MSHSVGPYHCDQQRPLHRWVVQWHLRLEASFCVAPFPFTVLDVVQLTRCQLLPSTECRQLRYHERLLSHPKDFINTGSPRCLDRNSF